VSVDKEEMIEFWMSSASASVSRNLRDEDLANSLIQRQQADYFQNSIISSLFTDTSLVKFSGRFVQ